ncbi:MAG TPA: DegT/DnrJ/EryC1/StrS family aminotransferase [Thermoanaerobaculia bacterium]|nr:DegT/DnrJ/EryC1/StrS family aminotransferase [Thermoanaerobaculia bacterium]
MNVRRRAARKELAESPVGGPATVPLLDLTRYEEKLRGEISQAVAAVFASGKFILGPANEAFERAFASRLGVGHALGVSSGTDALLVALMALGVEPGDEVITSPFTFFASAGAVARLGARPVFVDIEPDGFTLDPARLESAITPRTKAIEPVHLFGQCADMTAILSIANRRGIPVLEDACQAVGAAHRGRLAGTMGRVAAFSFYPTKNLGAAGDAGAVVTDDDRLAERVRALRVHGSLGADRHEGVGGNFRMDAVQAAVIAAKLPYLDEWNRRRREIAALYGELLGDAARAGRLTLPEERPGERHVFHQYVVRIADRDRVGRELESRGIATSALYAVPLHRQECFSSLGYGPGSFPAAERASREALALPIFPQLFDEEIARVAEALLDCLD